MPPLDDDVLEVRGAVGRAYVATLRAIADGEWPAGSLISEGDVARRLSLSRTPVREAFLRLEREELLTLYPRRGSVVVGFDRRHVLDLLDTRYMFECAAVEQLAERGGPPGLAGDLQALVDAQDGVREDPWSFALLDRRFHEAIVGAPDNRVARALFVQTGPRLLCLSYRAVQGDAQLRRQIIEEHRRLGELAVAGDVRGYRAALHEHLACVRAL